MDLNNFFFVYQANTIIIVRTVEEKISLIQEEGLTP